MSTSQTIPTVTDNPGRNRYELDVDGSKAVAIYSLRGDEITFLHTLVPAALQGRGIASQVVVGALASVRARGLKVVPQCPVFKAYMRKHPETHDLLSAAGRQVLESEAAPAPTGDAA